MYQLINRDRLIDSIYNSSFTNLMEIAKEEISKAAKSGEYEIKMQKILDAANLEELYKNKPTYIDMKNIIIERFKELLIEKDFTVSGSFQRQYVIEWYNVYSNSKYDGQNAGSYKVEADKVNNESLEKIDKKLRKEIPECGFVRIMDTDNIKFSYVVRQEIKRAGYKLSDDQKIIYL